MKRLGTVISKSASGLGVVRVKDIPRIGQDVVLEGRCVARVKNIVGPVKSPFVLVDGDVKKGDDLDA